MKDFVSGTYRSQGYYKSFQPNHINRAWVVSDMGVLKLLSSADRELGRLDMYSKYVDIDLFIRMHIAKEATQSSKIEGTQTAIGEAFLNKEEVAAEKRADWEEVQNYIMAMNGAVADLERFPISSRLIKKTHKTLLRGVRGQHRLPGQYRSSQNWIGGASINDAVFVPPVHNTVQDLMSDLEKFVNDPHNPLPDLLKVALIHYQFETIHPFSDGNGRVGRLLITLYLVSKGILKQPILYLSDFLQRNRILYYDNLTRVREHNDLSQWFKFFLTGVIQTAASGVATFDGILQLQEKVDEKLKTLTSSRSHDAREVISYLYANLVVDAAKVRQIVKKSKVSAYKVIADLERLKIIKETTGLRRGRRYIFKDYLQLFSRDEQYLNHPAPAHLVQQPG